VPDGSTKYGTDYDLVLEPHPRILGNLEAASCVDWTGPSKFGDEIPTSSVSPALVPGEIP
jgi:hypothetical protein